MCAASRAPRIMSSESVAYTQEPESESAGADLAEQIQAGLGEASAGAIVVFASPRYDYAALLRTLADACAPAALVGASSSGELTGDRNGSGGACALALQAVEVRFSAGLGRGLRDDPEAAARSIVSSFQGLHGHEFPYRTALVMTDVLAGDPDDLVDRLARLTAGTYQFFGGGAGDDARFQRTHVFFGTEPVTDAAVALEMLSQKPVGLGVAHGWEPLGPKLRVTEVRGSTLVSLNGVPAIESFEAHADAIGARLDRAHPLPFFIHNVLGIVDGSSHRLRVPIALERDGSVTCAAPIPPHAVVRMMVAAPGSAERAAELAARTALSALDGERPRAAVLFDCASTRLRLGDLFGLEVAAVERVLSGVPLMGCNSHGQIARAEGRPSGFHNCTAVVFVLPR